MRSREKVATEVETALDDSTFLHRFETCTFPFSEWKHRQHIKAAYLYLRAYPFDAAVNRIRESIQRYNAAHRASDPSATTGAGYHETLTQAWMHVVHATLHAFGPAADSDAFCDEHPHLTQKTLLRLYYSRDRMLSAEAISTFVRPDLAPLPVARRSHPDAANHGHANPT